MLWKDIVFLSIYDGGHLGKCKYDWHPYCNFRSGDIQTFKNSSRRRPDAVDFVNTWARSVGHHIGNSPVLSGVGRHFPDKHGSSFSYEMCQLLEWILGIYTKWSRTTDNNHRNVEHRESLLIRPLMLLVSSHFICFCIKFVMMAIQNSLCQYR